MIQRRTRAIRGHGGEEWQQQLAQPPDPLRVLLVEPQEREAPLDLLLVQAQAAPVEPVGPEVPIAGTS